jgi:(1->4)-alpha-D-glucan 1-alpha-D-glucosylmutase
VNIPRATYRLQFNHEFTFADAARVVPYLARLGISHVYASPILKARPGSMHGYDVTDHTRLNPELGTPEDFAALVATLREHSMGLIVDIVPNHLGVMGDDNVWWLDVLENGPAARAAHHFDIDWRATRPSMRDRVLVPILGDPYGAVLERGELQLHLDPAAGSFAIRYHEHLLPIDPREYPRIFAQSPIPATLLAADDAHRADFESLLNAFGNLPARSDTSEDSIAIRYRDKEAHKRRLVRLLERSPEIQQHIEATVARLNGTTGEPRSFDALDALLDAQAYRLSYWRVAVDEINYRRFFDVNDLAALRMDETAVFDSTHRLIFELIERGMIDGRENPRGLRAPAGNVAHPRHDRLRVRGADDQLARLQRVRNADDTALSPVQRVRRDVRADRLREPAARDALLARCRGRSAGDAIGPHRSTGSAYGRLHARRNSRSGS